MRFKKYLEKNRYEPYAEKYLQFNELIAKIRPEFTKEDEDAFNEDFAKNIDDVFYFIQFKYEDLESRMISLEELLKESTGIKTLSEVQDEMCAFAEFIRINIEGFKIILAKHDKKTGYTLIPAYKKMFKKKLNEIEQLNKLIYSVSRMKLKTLVIKNEKESNTVFVRKTRKYWVHSENLYSLKLKIVKHLPLYVYNPTPDPDATPYSAWDHKMHDTCVSSVYLDNSNFDLYTGRLYKNQGAEAIRIRWYGSEIPNVVFIERKRHEDNWTGFSSKKLRFKIAEKYVVDFLNGKNVWENVKMLNGSDAFELYKEVQTEVVSKKLRPSVRTFYKRNAFQLPNDSTVRISLDTDLVMLKETTTENDNGMITRWKRPDALCNWPFKSIPKEEIVRFPYAILEIKTQCVEESSPKWIEEIIKSSYVEHVHKYSKFMHGTAVLFKQIEVIPYWLPQMRTDIRKDAFHPLKDVKVIERNLLVVQPGERENSSDTQSLIEDHGKKIAMPIRVEPKVFLANERTFLKWVQFSIFLGGVGTAILGFGDENAAWCGGSLILVSIIFVFYALYVYWWRTKKIRVRFAGPYDDLLGPTILVSAFLIALFLSIVFKYPSALQAEDME